MQKKLIAFIESHPQKGYQTSLAKELGRDPTYFWRQLRGIRPLTVADAIKIEKYTKGRVRCEDMLPDLDWAALRRSARRRAPRVASV
jgi:DNA-binding transcriptional regulator YdaS (Cro superfamily)